MNTGIFLEHHSSFFLAVLVGSLVSVLTLAAFDHPLFSLAICAFFIAYLFVARFHILFPMLLVARSSLDVFTEVGVTIGPMNLNVPSLVSLSIDLLGLLYLAFIFQRDRKIPFDPIARAFSIWLFFLLFWVLWAYETFGIEGLLGLREWVRLSSLLMIYILSSHLAAIKGYRYLVSVTLLSLIVPFIVTFHQILTGTGLMVAGAHRVYGTMAHPNVLSLYLTLFIGVVAWKGRFSKKPIWWMLLLLFLLFSLLNTFSLGGYVLGGVLLMVLAYKETNFKHRLLIALLLIALFSIALNTESGMKRMEELRATPPLTEIIRTNAVTNSFTWRIINWKYLLEKWTDHPILGYGLNTSGLVNPWYNYAVHNDYLRFLLETGLIGFSVYICFLYAVVVNIRKKLLLIPDPEKKYLLMVLGAVFVAMLIESTVDNCITSTTFHFYFWSILASVMAEEKCSRDETKGARLNPLPT